MKKIVMIGIVLGLLAACAANGKIATSQADIDWSKTSKYYHSYISGLAIPAGAIASITFPQFAPLIAIAETELSNLDTLIASKASNADIQKQADIVYKAVTDANQAFGEKE